MNTISCSIVQFTVVFLYWWTFNLSVNICFSLLVIIFHSFHYCSGIAVHCTYNIVGKTGKVDEWILHILVMGSSQLIVDNLF